jgi:glycosyltransferase involved in cell wall biosynthesis
MKIYFIGQKGIPAKFGGVERHVEELAIRLAKKGHEVYAYTRPNYTSRTMKEYKGVNLISLPSISSKNLDAISHTFRACLDVVKRDADIVHFHSIGPSSLLWLVKIMKPGTPVIATFHTRCYTHAKWGGFAKLYLKFGEIVTCTLPDRTIAISRSLTDFALRKYGKICQYIPNGVQKTRYAKPELIKKLWDLEKGSYILTVSRLVRHKGIHYLIKAYQGLNTKKKLVIVGDSAYTDDYVNEIRQMAYGNPDIIFTGNQSGQVLNELLSNAFVFVQPSESEGLSIALLEAMAFGLATVVSDIPENKEAVEQSGVTFKNKDANDLKKELEYLLKRPATIKRLGEAAKKRAIETYDWENITKETIKVYNTITSNEESKAHRIRFRLARRILNLFI